jgi:hypothetical protein
MSSLVSPEPDVYGSARRRPGFRARELWRSWSNAESGVVVARSEWPVALGRSWRIGLALIGLQFVGLCLWGTILGNRWALQEDFATHQQATFLIAHGTLDPFSTVQNFRYWQDHAELLFWLLAPFQYLGAHAVLMYAQAAATVAAEAVALRWMCDLIAGRRGQGATSERTSAILALTGTVLLVANPWVYWGLSFDVHTEPFAMLFAVGAARALHQGRRSLWIWVALGLLVGDVAASYLGAIGVSAALTAQWRWRRGLSVAACGFVWLFVIQAVGGNHGDALRQYNNLVVTTGSKSTPKITAATLLSAIIEHPERPLSALWTNRANVWANVSPSGVLGFLWLPVLIPSVLLLGESELGGSLGAGFSQPGFQNILLTCLGAVGTVALLIRLSRTRRRPHSLLLAAVAVVTANAVLWAVVWLPQVSTRWLRVSPQAASVLSQLSHRIRSNDEVVAQNGVIGGFADHKYVYQVPSDAHDRFPAESHRIWFVMAPNQGIEVLPPAPSHRLISEVAALPYSQLVVSRDGVYAFLLTPPASVKIIDPAATDSTAAWSFAGPSGTPVASGPSDDWYIAGNSDPGYVLDHAYWREGPGTYQAVVDLASTGPADVEIWNSTTDQLLARRSESDTDGHETVALNATLNTTPTESTFDGWGVWRINAASPRGDNLEVRVYSPGGATVVDVYRVSLHRVRSG